MNTSAKPVITKQAFEAAKYSADKLRPLADALAAVTDQALGHNPEAIAKFNDFCDFITPKLLEAGAIIARAQIQYDARDQILINAASTRFLAIDGLVREAESKQRLLRDGYDSKVEELAKKQFSPEEISNIVSNPSQEIEAMNTVIKSLQAEKPRLQAYLADAPEYREAFLTGTGVFALKDVRELMKNMTTTASLVVKP